MNWILNTSYDEKNQTPNGLLNEFIFDTRADGTNLEQNHRVLVLINTADSNLKGTQQEIKNDFFGTFMFIQSGIIKEIGKPIKLGLSGKEIKENEERKLKGLRLIKEKKQYKIKIRIKKELNENNKLNDLVYSLQNVYNYRKPITHFQQQITSLNDIDFDTIEREQIYMSRTIFGKLINVLPFENKYEFAVMMGREEGDFNFKGVNYLKYLEKLVSYIDNRFLNRGRLLINSAKILTEMATKIDFNNEETGFYNETLDVSNNISTQSKLFEDLFQTYNLLELLSDLKNIKEDRFLTIFRKKEWPLYLN